MDDENKQELPAPPRFRYKGFKFMTLALFFVVIFVILGFSGIKATSSSQFCSTCHEMKPEYYTWKASTHSEVDCVSCHTDPALKKLAKDKADGIVELYKNQTNTFTAPIHMTKEIPNSACNKCHDMSKRQVTPSGDLIIPHDKHINKGIECVQCHSGVAHGKIADRKMTFQADYDKWNQEVGTSAMADTKFTSPDMDTCMECHKARNVSTACKTCHTTGMVPKSHKQPDFKTKTHGVLAGKQLKECNECHKYMSTDKLEGYDNASPLDKYLKQDSQQQKKNQYDYAKENTFCQNCHLVRPESHENGFINKHGKLVEANQNTCLACHDIKRTSSPSKNPVNCSSCHPSSHSKNPNWRNNHPIQVGNIKGPIELCYTCHVKQSCKSCHKD
jgi:nitrate/TMAO reductase-like tetraheme cytochrome c subunit